jgi:hypothetical protein
MNQRDDRQRSGAARPGAVRTALHAAGLVPVVAVLVGVLGGCTSAAPTAAPPAATPSPATPSQAPPPAAGGTATPGIGSAVSAPATTSTTIPGAPSTVPAPVEAALGPEEQRVAGALRTYLTAVAAGDFAGACGQLTVESAQALVTAVQRAGGAVPGCPEALGAVLVQPGAAQTAIDAASTTTVQEVTIDGFTATVRWSSTQRGAPRTDAVALQSVAGQWRLAGPA